MVRSRRWFLCAIPVSCGAALAEKNKPAPSALFRYSDPSTEFQVVRLTDPEFTSLLPPHFARSQPKRGNFLLYASDATGRMEAFRMESKGGITRQLTEQEGLYPASLTLTPDERSFCCLAGDKLLSVNAGNGRIREVCQLSAGFEPAGFGLAEDGLYGGLIEKKGELHRLRLIKMTDGSSTTLAEASEPMRNPIPRPRRAAILYGRGSGIWLANYDAQQNYRLKVAPGETGPYTWHPSGTSFFYLNFPADPHKLHNIREFTPDMNSDAAIADTTQFVAFERNADASVFVGASGSKASPHVLLLVRSVKRELTLCEHRASDPRMVSPIFSPNSQNIFFGSDQHGKPAIYTMAVEKFVAETDSTQ